jgi:hypothetical protein
MIFYDFSRFCWFLWSSETLTLFHDFFQHDEKVVVIRCVIEYRETSTPPKSMTWFYAVKLIGTRYLSSCRLDPKWRYLVLRACGPQNPKNSQNVQKVPKNRLFYAQNGCSRQKYRKFGSTGRPHPSESGWDGPCRQTLF